MSLLDSGGGGGVTKKGLFLSDDFQIGGVAVVFCQNVPATKRLLGWHDTPTDG